MKIIDEWKPIKDFYGYYINRNGEVEYYYDNNELGDKINEIIDKINEGEENE